ncbi:MAG: imidazoleglycerol-phosphate dehydratase, partial [Desulfovibrio sp.]|nr:imidazoleglycerol-phosphate dehydratase [Desulfovibrio sp.]
MTHAPRTSAKARISAETDIRLELTLDGQGKTDIRTGFGLLDHMLILTAFWAGMDLTLVCKGDMQVDAHHTAEDIGLTLGKALLEALGDKAGIARVNLSLR